VSVIVVESLSETFGLYAFGSHSIYLFMHMQITLPIFAFDFSLPHRHFPDTSIIIRVELQLLNSSMTYDYYILKQV